MQKHRLKATIIYFISLLLLSTCNEEELSVIPQSNPSSSSTEQHILNWFNQQQLPNGLLESVEGGNIVSLYDNALAALVFMLNEDYPKAEKIFDFFNANIFHELKSGAGGFSQFRDRNGIPNQHRWMGDNAWLLIALQNYKVRTGKSTYDNLAQEIADWLQSLQDTDGGLFAGYGADDALLDYKVTEGNIDAFNAIDGFTDFHQQILNYLKRRRWNTQDKNLVSWPSNPPYLYALDLHSWSYLIFEDYPISALTNADRFLNNQMAFNGSVIKGYCFDEDKDVVWLEGTGQMALAFGRARMETAKVFYLTEMEKIWIPSANYPNAGGFPYASNLGTSYGADDLWTGANTKICISSGAWYLFAKRDFNPFEVGRNKNIPAQEAFWKRN
ncbi:MAG: hypothetical protein AAF705_11960 [Bacteroidota bacterium]